ncbi:hypothetical protein HRG_014876 [Hirsutella rhossiliensis]
MPNKVPFKGFHPFQVFVIFLFALTLGHLVQGRRRRHHDGTASLYATEATSFLRFRGLPGRARCLFVFDHPWHPPAQSSTLGFGFALDRPPYAARETILP